MGTISGQYTPCRRSGIALIVPLLMVIVGGSGRVEGGEAIWSGWLGGDRDGWVREFQAPEVWPKALEKKWRVEVGAGYGSPVVAGGRVYQHARQGEEEVLWCLDLKTGDVQWEKRYAVPYRMGMGGERHGKGPKASPLLHDGKVFTMSITGKLSAWDAGSGKLLWRRDYDAEFGKSHVNWGSSISPIVDGDRIITHFGTDKKGALAALDVATGDEVWRQATYPPAYSSPLVVEIGGVRQVVEWNKQALVGVDAERGKLLWAYPMPDDQRNQNMPTPVYCKGGVLLGGEERGVRRLEPEVEGGKWTVTERWFQGKVALDMSTAVLHGDLVFGFSHYGKGRLFCLDAETGKVLWQGPERVGENATLLAVEGYVVALTNGGELKVVAASGEGYQEAASYQVADSETWAPAVLMQAGVLVKDLEGLAFFGWGE